MKHVTVLLALAAVVACQDRAKDPGGDPMPKQKFVTCLWFRDRAEEALEFYTSLFPDSEVLGTMRGPGDALISANFRMHGHELMVLNGNQRASFNDSCSIVVRCESQGEVDRLWDALLANGGAPSRCGWLKDRFGVSWQIVPNALMEMLGDKDPARAQRVMEAMLKMDKFVIADLRRAYEGK
jgi:predicted 3-demethylubiquinone-9 3-methyltransferase (glyoxalase superfamily)